jgi:hypothetical protein
MYPPGGSFGTTIVPAPSPCEFTRSVPTGVSNGSLGDSTVSALPAETKNNGKEGGQSRQLPLPMVCTGILDPEGPLVLPNERANDADAVVEVVTTARNAANPTATVRETPASVIFDLCIPAHVHRIGALPPGGLMESASPEHAEIG